MWQEKNAALHVAVGDVAPHVAVKQDVALHVAVGDIAPHVAVKQVAVHVATGDVAPLADHPQCRKLAQHSAGHPFHDRLSQHPAVTTFLWFGTTGLDAHDVPVEAMKK
jgi:hypothetical protein